MTFFGGNQTQIKKKGGGGLSAVPKKEICPGLPLGGGGQFLNFPSLSKFFMTQEKPIQIEFLNNSIFSPCQLLNLLLDSIKTVAVNIIFNFIKGNIMHQQTINVAQQNEIGENQHDLDEEPIEFDHQEMNELYSSYNLMKQFCSEATKDCKMDSCEILEKYADKKISLEISPKNVMQILDKRIQRMLKNKKLKKNWSSQDAQILYWTFSRYCKINQIDSVQQANLSVWDQISRLIPGCSPDSCMFKILSLKKTNLAKKKWTQQQSQLLSQITMEFQHKKNWRFIAQELFKRNPSEEKIFRNAKQCKQHWVCYLNPELKKGSWSILQDKKLLEHIRLNKGTRKWAELSRIFGGRTQNALKNRYCLLIERLRKESTLQGDELVEKSDLQIIQNYLKSIQRLDQSLLRKKHFSRKRKFHAEENSKYNISSEILKKNKKEKAENQENLIENRLKESKVQKIQPVQMQSTLNFPSFVPMMYDTSRMQFQYYPNFGLVNPIYIIYSNADSSTTN